MKMKLSTLALMATMAVSMSHSVLAENQAGVMPPPGPYRAMSDVGQYPPNQFVHNNSQKEEGRNNEFAQYLQPNREVPEWVKQQRLQMRQQANMPQMQHWNKPQNRWYKEQEQLMPPVYQGPGYGANMPNYRMQQTMPVVPKPGYDPRVQSREPYQQSGYPPAQY